MSDAHPPTLALAPVLLFAAIGPNPASVAEAIWALHRHRGQGVVEAHLVSLERGHYWLEQELLGHDGALAELRTVLPEVLPAGEAAVIEHLTIRPDGGAVADDSAAADAALYRAAVWAAARACVERAGARPVVFLLAGGRQRTMTAYAVAVFQLLARGQDELVDVRVSDRRAEGGSGFFFPEQRQHHLVTDQGVLDARTVEVSLVPVMVPRLAGLLAPEHLTSFEIALETSRLAIEALTPPRLVVDLAAGVVRVNGERVPLSPGQVAWYGLLAVKRVRDGAHGDGAVAADGRALLTELMSGITAAKWAGAIRDYTVRSAVGLPMIHGTRPNAYPAPVRLGKLRTDTRTAIEQWLRSRVRPAWEGLLVPASFKRDGDWFQRIAMDPGHIEITWPA